MKRVGVITVHKNVNYGANLQAFASVKFLNGIGVNASLVDYVLPSQKRCASLIGWLRESWKNEGKKSFSRKIKLGMALALSAPWKARRLHRFSAFRRKFIPLTRPCENPSDVSALGLDTVVVGSDQIWAPHITGGIDPVYFGAIDGVQNRVSYAASIGGTVFSAEEESAVKRLVNGLTSPSVREEPTAEYLRAVTGRDIEVVSDPVFLLDRPEYEALETKRKIKGDYVLLYSVVHNDKLSEIAGKYAESQGMQLVEICMGDSDGNHRQVSDWGPREFLSAFHHAGVVLTNSFHGVAFSIIYKKQFFAVNNKSGGSRITNLLKKVGLSERLIDEVPTADCGRIDYNAVEPLLSEYVEHSREFLRRAVSKKMSALAGKDCTGCSACTAVCARGAISMATDVEGFPVAYVDEARCVGCDLCRQACPALNEARGNQPVATFAYKAGDDVRKNSSSGGVFADCAKMIIESGGAVYGAALKDDFSVCHERVADVEALSALQGTKYVQSRVEGCHKAIEKDLRDGKAVLFSGTPCQVDGVRRFAERKKLPSDKLYLVDLICHGVPSPVAFREFVRWFEEQIGEKVKEFYFRSKEVSWRGESCMAVTESGRKIVGDRRLTAFMNAYYSKNLTRESCFACKYANKVRVSDLTISDFWGIENALPEFEDGLGVSMVLVNTEKGKRLFDELPGKRAEADLAKAKQPRLYQPTSRPATRGDAHNTFCASGVAPILKEYGGIKRQSLKTVLYKIKKKLFK